MMFCASILALLAIGGSAVVASASDCDHLDKLVDDEDSFNECLQSGVWTKPLPLYEVYDVAENEPCSWCVDVMPRVLALIQAESASDVEDLIATGTLGSLFAVQDDSEKIRDSFLLQVCASLKGEATRAQCANITRSYYKMIIAMVASGVPNERVCSLLDVCSIKKNICYSTPQIVCGDKTIAEKCGMTELCMTYEWNKEGTKKSEGGPVSVDVECVECKAFMDTLKKYLSDPSNRQTVIEDAEKLCTRFLSQAQCDKYVGETIGTLMMMLENEVSSDKLCSMIGMCKDEKTARSSGLLGADECVASLETICSDFKYAQRCGKMRTCVDFGIRKGGVSSGDYLSAWGLGDVVCDTCEEVVEAAKQYLESSSDSIEAEVLQLCDKCPVKDQCVTYVKQYLPDLLELVEANLDGPTICGMMNLCGSKQQRDQRQKVLDLYRVPEEYSDVKCDNSQASCPDGNTCCPIKSGALGCCPVANAVCCADSGTCCPPGYTCSSKSGLCLRGPAYMILVNKPPQVSAPPKPVFNRERRRRAAESEDEEVPSLNAGKLLEWGQGLASQLMGKWNTGTCTACKIVMKYKIDKAVTSEMYSDAYWTELREKVCKQATDEGVECPSLEGIRGIVQAAEVHPEEECPIKSLCEEEGFDIIGQLNELMCTVYGKVLETVDDSQTWDSVFGAIEQHIGDKPMSMDTLNYVMRFAREQQAEEHISKKKAMINSFMQNVPGFAQCNISE